MSRSGDRECSSSVSNSSSTPPSRNAHTALCRRSADCLQLLRGSNKDSTSHTDYSMYSTCLTTSPGSVLFTRSNLLKRKDLCFSCLRLGLISHRRSLRSSHLFLKWTATILSCHHCSSFEEATRDRQVIEDTLLATGIVRVSLKGCFDTPTQTLPDHLLFIISNIGKGALWVPERRCFALRRQARALLFEATKNRRLVDSDLLCRFAGATISCLPAVPLTRFHLREIFNVQEQYKAKSFLS